MKSGLFKSESRVITGIFVIWVVFATLFTIGMTARKLNRPYDNEPHVFAIADMAIMASNFARNGVIALHGIPIMNNPPVGKRADAYVDWPPLYPIILGVFFRHFGESEATARTLALVFSLGFLCVFYLLVSTLVNRETAIAAVFAVQVLPIFVICSSTWTVNAGLGMSLLAFLAIYKATMKEKIDWAWAVLGAVALITGVALSWEPLLLAPALLPIAIWQRRRLMTRVVLVYGALAVLTAGALLLLYVSSFPELKAHLIQKISFRLGWGYNAAVATSLNTFVARQTNVPFSIKASVLKIATRLLLLLGSIAIVAMGGCFLWVWNKRKTENGKTLVLLFGGLLLPWLLWYTIFLEHAGVHEYQLLLAVPVAALSIATALVGLGHRSLSNTHTPEYSLRWIWLGLVPVVLLGAAMKVGHESLMETLTAVPSPPMRYAKDLRENTDPDSVILSPLLNFQVTYYSNRHIVRGIVDDSVLSEAIAKLPEEFPHTKVYLAIPLQFGIDSPMNSIARFPGAMSRYAVIRQDETLVLLDVGCCR